MSDLNRNKMVIGPCNGYTNKIKKLKRHAFTLTWFLFTIVLIMQNWVLKHVLLVYVL